MAKPSKLDLSKTYAAQRASFATDAIFLAGAKEAGVSLTELDAYVASTPAAEALWSSFDGLPDQYRYAVLKLWATAQGTGAKPTTLDKSLACKAESKRVVEGDLVIQGELSLGNNAVLVVLGELRVDGAVLHTDDYAVIAARSMQCESLVFGGELIALEEIHVRDRAYLFGNDHSCRAPRFRSRVLVDHERGNAFGKVEATTHPKDEDAAVEALGLEGDAADHEDLPKAFAAIIRKGARKPAPVKPKRAAVKASDDDLYKAAKDSNVAALKRLLAVATWPPEALTTALRFATQWYRSKNVEALLAHGATDPTHEVFRLPTDEWCMKRLWAAMGPPVDSEAARELLHAAVTARNPSEGVLKFLLQQGIDVNAATPDGVTALHLVATRKHNRSMMEVLLHHGANREARTKTASWEGCPVAGATPVDVAERHGNSHFVEILKAG